MLKPSDDFTADQIRFLQNEAQDWIQSVNNKIINAAENGEHEVYISIYDNENNKPTSYYEAHSALDAHFEARGFNVKRGGQSGITISWYKKPD